MEEFVNVYAKKKFANRDLPIVRMYSAQISFNVFLTKIIKENGYKYASVFIDDVVKDIEFRFSKNPGHTSFKLTFLKHKNEGRICSKPLLDKVKCDEGSSWFVATEDWANDSISFNYGEVIENKSETVCFECDALMVDGKCPTKYCPANYKGIIYAEWVDVFHEVYGELTSGVERDSYIVKTFQQFTLTGYRDCWDNLKESK